MKTQMKIFYPSDLSARKSAMKMAIGSKWNLSFQIIPTPLFLMPIVRNAPRKQWKKMV
jgi:hypothetical protein